MYFKENDGYILSNAGLFYIPDTTNVSVTVPAHGYHTSASSASSYKPMIYIGASNSGQKNGSGTSAKVNISPNSDDSNFTIVNKTFALTPSLSRICVYGENQSHVWDIRYLKIKSVSVKYSI